MKNLNANEIRNVDGKLKWENFFTKIKYLLIIDFRKKDMKSKKILNLNKMECEEKGNKFDLTKALKNRTNKIRFQKQNGQYFSSSSNKKGHMR